jgi:uncharacterized protein (TIGR02231 family)
MTDSEANHKTQLIINTKIEAVTVYNDQALIIRQAKLELTGTEKELILEGLPLSLKIDSVRSRGSGTIPVKILGLQTEQVFASEPFNEKIVRLNQEIQEQEIKKRTVEDQLEALKLQRNLVQGLGDKYLERFSSLAPSEQINLEDISNLLNFIGQKDQNYASQIAQNELELKAINDHLEALKQKLRQGQNIKNRQSYSSYRIIINIESERTGTFDLEVSYLVNYASWTPLYDLRATLTGEALNLTYLAEVQQKTGEDWDEVNLTLSTAQPSLGKLPSQLKPFYIKGSPLNSAHQEHAYAGRGVFHDQFAELERLSESSTKDLEEIFTDSSSEIEAEQVTASSNQVGGIVTFSLDRKNTIPSDGKFHKVTLFNRDYSCQTQYISIPRLESVAYLEAKAINSLDGVTLLSGKANIFRENTFIGTTQLANIAPGQSFKVNLGIDESIKVVRNLVKRDVELIGNYRRINYSYRIQVTNLKETKSKLQLIEQLPISRDEKIKIRLLRTHPEIELGDMGKLEWSLVLQPLSHKQSSKEIIYESSTEYPLDLTISYDS